MHRSFLLVAGLIWLASPVASAGEITRLWLTHRTHDPSKIVVNWETDSPGNSIVHYGVDANLRETARQDDHVTLHHVEIPLAADAARYHYRVTTGQDRSAPASFKAYPSDLVRIAVVANWQARPKLDALIADDIHVLTTAGDNVDSLHRLCGPGKPDCTKPYSALIADYPELFRTTPFLPILGNHDREIRPRGDKPPADPVYDVEAQAFRAFFELPGDEWKWHFDIPSVDLRLIALDLNHISDQGTTWQTCHPLTKDSPQFLWYEKLMSAERPATVVTLYNERNSTMRSQEGMAWHELFRKGTIAVTGFGYFAERAEVDGFPYYNTSLGGKGAKYADPKSKFFASEDNYLLLSVGKDKLRVEIKNLDGNALDQKDYPRQK